MGIKHSNCEDNIKDSIAKRHPYLFSIRAQKGELLL